MEIAAASSKIGLLVQKLFSVYGSTIPIERVDMISKLRFLLKNLPDSLPLKSAEDASINFLGFEPDPEWIDRIGTVEGAVNREIEVRVGPRNNAEGTFKLTERGPGIEALADVLEKYTTEFPDDVILNKWVADSSRAAENAFRDAEKSVSFNKINVEPSCLDVPVHATATDPVVTIGSFFQRRASAADGH